MADNSDFKVPLVKKAFTIKNVSKLEKSANALDDDSDDVDVRRMLLLEEEESLEMTEENTTKPNTPSEAPPSKTSSSIPSRASSSIPSKASSSIPSKKSSSTAPAPVSVPYKEPQWSSCDETSALYSLEVIKQGCNVGQISLKGKSSFVIGRLPSCDIQLEHPSISRHHAVLQYKRAEGWHLFDLESTHGSFLNKRRLPARRYMRLHVGHVIKIGGSSRVMVVVGPEGDREEEGEMKKMKKKVDEEESGGCGWGMVEQEEEEDDGVNPFAVVEDDSFYKDDPRKALKQVFQREGVEGPQFEFEGVGLNRTCKVELPVDGPSGEALMAEVRLAGSRRDAEMACALEACRLLDQHGLLREARHESVHKKRKKVLEENDFYDEDDDLYLDRTGDVERKRKERMRRVNQDSNEAASHESLVEEMGVVVCEMEELQGKLDADAELQRRVKEEEEDDDALELFMKGLKAGGLGAREKMDTKRRLLELKHSRARLEKLIDISKPTPILLAPPPCQSDKRSRRGVNVPKFEDLASMKDEEIGGINETVVEINEKDGENNVNVGKIDENVEENNENVEENNKNVEENSKNVDGNNFDDKMEEKKSVNNLDNDKKSVDNLDNLDHHNNDKAELLVTNITPSSSNITSNNNEINNDDNKDIFNKTTKTYTMKDDKEIKTNNHDDKINQENNSMKAKVKPPSKSKKFQSSLAGEDNQSEADIYSTWLPPSNQSGDGKTTLNKRFGY